MQLRGAQALHDIAVSLVDQQREIVELTQSQAKVGLASELDVKSATAQLAQTQAQLPQYEQQIAQALNGLAYLVGEPPGALEARACAGPRRCRPCRLPCRLACPQPWRAGGPIFAARRRVCMRRLPMSASRSRSSIPMFRLTGQMGTRATNASDLSRWSQSFLFVWAEHFAADFPGRRAGVQSAVVESAASGSGARLSQDSVDGAARRGQCARRVSHGSGAPRFARRKRGGAAGVVRSGARQLSQGALPVSSTCSMRSGNCRKRASNMRKARCRSVPIWLRYTRRWAAAGRMRERSSSARTVSGLRAAGDNGRAG